MRREPTLGGLFSGIGGFELAWQRNGGRVAWMCEIDKHARKVLAERFPGVPIYEDVEQLDPAEVEPVDVLTGGSPCQGFSIAGARAGLEHGESRLFADYVRIMDGLAERGLKWAVWENVPGVLSIKNDDGERTFEHVIGALAGADAAVRLPNRKWNAGVVAGAGRSVAWRVVDSRHFGVPQRRRRVYAAVAFGDSDGSRAGRAVLAVPEGVRRDPPACVTKGQEPAGGIAGRAGGTGVPAHVNTLTSKMQGMSGWAPYNETEHLVPDVAGTLKAKGSGGIDDLDRMTFVPDISGTLTAGAHPGSSNGQDVYNDMLFVDVAHTLTKASSKGATEDGTGRGTPIVAQAFNWQQGDAEYSLREDATALAADSRPAVLMTMREGKPGGGKGPLLATEESLTLATGNGQTSFQPEWSASETGTLQARTYKGLNHENARDGQAVVQHYGVRRLTPVECERLQAFPDGWTEPAGSDSARYKALGNAVTVNVPQWLFGRMLEVDGVR